MKAPFDRKRQMRCVRARFNVCRWELASKQWRVEDEEIARLDEEIAWRSGIDKSEIRKMFDYRRGSHISAADFFRLCETFGYDPLRAWYGDEQTPEASR